MLDSGPLQPAPTPPRRLTGKHMMAIFIAFFGIVFVVNFYMAHLATSTFSGEVVENSYVASQKFNIWLDQAAREKALGWRINAVRRADGRVVVTVAGLKPEQAVLSAIARRPLGEGTDRPLRFILAGNDFVSSDALPAGRWLLRLQVHAGGHQWHGQQAL